MVFRFKIKIDDIKTPQVWRVIDVPTSWSFEKFNEVIQVAFGWQNAHLWEFSDKREGYGDGTIRIAEPSEFDAEHDVQTLDAYSTKLSDIFPNFRRMKYIYDFGDYWQHEIRLVETIDKNARKAKCVEGRGTCPPEDCGGTGGYEEMKKAFKKETEEAESYREWLGFDENETWNPDGFNLKGTNEELRYVLPY